MTGRWRNPFFLFGLVLLWRLALLLFTAQPIPANDAFFYDGAIVNWLHAGHYCNPAIADLFPISGTQVFSSYPPGYQAALLLWFPVFGTSVISAMALHLTLFAISGLLTLTIVKRFFPSAINYAIIALLFFGITFGDRPEDLAHIFGLGSLLLLAQSTAGNFNWHRAAFTTLLLLGALFTSPVSAAFYFAAGFFTVALGWLTHQKIIAFIPFAAVTILFATITFAVTKLEPVWWAGFMETARQQSVVTSGFHLPRGVELLKLVRTAPVFLVAIFFVPLAIKHRQQFSADAWLRLAAGIFLAGWTLIAADLTLLSANYIGYVLFSQIILAAGLLALIGIFFSSRARCLRLFIFCCAALMSIRAIGLTTWGAACAWENSYAQTQTTLRVELAPFATNNTPVFISSAFCYDAEKLRVRHPVLCDWYFNHATWTNNAQLNGLVRSRPAKLVLTQFDYYRSFERVLAQLRQHPELAAIRVRDLAEIKPPDAIPALSRVVQNISWAPVIVDLDWK
jgi:hypothetical protein